MTGTICWRKRCSVILVAALAVGLGATQAFAQSAGSFAGNFAGFTIIPTTTCTPDPNTGSCTGTANSSFLTAIVKQSGAASKSLEIQGSLQTSLLTQTTVNSSNGSKSTSTVSGDIVVTPTITDSSGKAFSVYPASVVYDARLQSLTANLLGLNCTADLTTGVVTCTSPETIGLLLSTTSAHTFNFLAPDLPEGVYTVTLNVLATAQVCPTDANPDQLCTGTIQPGTAVDVGVGAGSLGVLTVQTQTPFNSLTFSN
jgi:hypothetical protein